MFDNTTMGRGGNSNDAAAAEARSGEIPLLDADRLDDHVSRAATETDTGTSFGDPDDDRALRRLISRLRRIPATAKLSDDELEDRAIDLYNRTCDKIRSGRATEREVAKAAALFGESPEHLRERLSPSREAEDEPAAGSGARGLIASLSRLAPQE